ncbi:MOLPALP family lipoprotein [Spiroplasma alleghenense]|uniref:MOLPALP family lipoprotein n=1 Tax=Spiroplasma alleghenense TaxID=216931 RepID=A0A345Z3H2_9MOLU|nr:MOLPALP family lipoprotein [Spiroplasma alleghenense]AXK51151.1 hypothetical protein SALLE_v1c04770 [Spiroplasma alleghenense]
MKKLLSILGTVAIVSSSAVVTSCSVVNKEISKKTSEFTFSEIAKFVAQAYALSDAENIKISDSIDYFANQKISNLMPDFNADSHTLMRTVFQNTFNNTNPVPEAFKNLKTDGSIILNGSRSFTDSSFSQISSIINIIVLTIKNGFGIKEATVIEGLLKSEAIGGLLTPDLLDTIGGFLSKDNLEKLGNAFDFNDLTGKTNQQAIDYSINSLTIGLAQLLGHDLIIDPKTNEELTLSTPFPETGKKDSGDATYLWEQIIGGFITGKISLEINIENIVSSISYIIKGLMIMAKYMSAFESYDNTINSVPTNHLNLFNNEIGDLGVVEKVRSSNFDTNNTLNFGYLLNLIDDAFNDKSTNFDGLGLQKLFSILFKIDDKKRHEFTILGNPFVNKGYNQLIVGISKGISYINAIPPTLQTLIPSLLYRIVLAVTNGAEFGVDSITLSMIKGFAPDIHAVLTDPEIIAKMNNIFNELYSGSIIQELLGLFGGGIDEGLLNSIQNIGTILKTPLKHLLRSFGLELPLILESLVNVSLRDAIRAFKNNYSDLKKVEINFDDIKKIFSNLAQTDLVYNALGEVQFNNEKQSGIFIILNMLQNPGWYVSKDGKKMDLTEYLGLDKSSQTLLPNSLFGSLKNLLEDNSADNNHSGLFMRKTLTGVVDILNFMNFEMSDNYKNVFLPFVNQDNFKQKNRFHTINDKNEEFISFEIEYTSIRSQVMHTYEFNFKLSEFINDKGNLAKYWEMVNINRKR